MHNDIRPHEQATLSVEAEAIRTLDGVKRLQNRGGVWASVCTNGNAVLIFNAARPCCCVVFGSVESCPQPRELYSHAARPGLIGVKDCQSVLQHRNRTNQRNDTC